MTSYCGSLFPPNILERILLAMVGGAPPIHESRAGSFAFAWELLAPNGLRRRQSSCWIHGSLLLSYYDEVGFILSASQGRRSFAGGQENKGPTPG